MICRLIKKQNKTKNPTAQELKKKRKENDAHVSRQGNDTHPPPFSNKQTASEQLFESQLAEESWVLGSSLTHSGHQRDAAPRCNQQAEQNQWQSDHTKIQICLSLHSAQAHILSNRTQKPLQPQQHFLNKMLLNVVFYRFM